MIKKTLSIQKITSSSANLKVQIFSKENGCLNLICMTAIHSYVIHVLTKLSEQHKLTLYVNMTGIVILQPKL